MPIEKVLRIVVLFIVVAAFAVHVASRLLFPESSHGVDLPIMIVMVLGLTTVWRETGKTEENSNR